MLSPHQRTSTHNLSIFISLWFTLRLRMQRWRWSNTRHTTAIGNASNKRNNQKYKYFLWIFWWAIMASVSPMPVALMLMFVVRVTHKKWTRTECGDWVCMCVCAVRGQTNIRTKINRKWINTIMKLINRHFVFRKWKNAFCVLIFNLLDFHSFAGHCTALALVWCECRLLLCGGWMVGSPVQRVNTFQTTTA